MQGLNDWNNPHSSVELDGKSHTFFSLQDASAPLELTVGSFFLLFHLGLLLVQLDLTS